MPKNRITRHTRLQHRIAPGSVRPPRSKPPTTMEYRAARREANPPMPFDALKSIWSSALSVLLKPKDEPNAGPQKGRRSRRGDSKPDTGNDQPARRAHGRAGRQEPPAAGRRTTG